MRIPPPSEITWLTIPSAILVKPYAVDRFNGWCQRLAAGEISQSRHQRLILRAVMRRDGMITIAEPVQIEPTGRHEGVLMEVILDGDEWWTPAQNIMPLTSPNQ